MNNKQDLSFQEESLTIPEESMKVTADLIRNDRKKRIDV